MSRRESSHDTVSFISVFAALGDTIRLELVSRLDDGQPQSIAQLADGLGITRQGVTKHLHLLEHAGIVTSEHVGRENRFVLVPKRIAKARSYLDHVSEQWEKAAARFKAFVDGERAPGPRALSPTPRISPGAS